MANEMHIIRAKHPPSDPGKRAVLEMIAFQRRIFEKQRRMIEGAEAHLSPGFSNYRNEYRRAVSGFVAPSGFGALCDAVASAKITYVADYHTLKLSQRTFVKLIRGIMPQVDQICLCMELIPADQQKALDDYLERRISEKTFLKRIRFKEHWPYDIWPNFKPIFDLAMDQGFVVIAIDSDPELSLKKRDAFSALQIAQAARRFPDACFLTFVGQMHAAPPHLPAAVDRAFARAGMTAPQRVIVYQNAEEIYWKLAEERQEGAEVVKVDDQSYCVNNTPPLVQQLSYLHWIQADSEEIMEYSELEQTVRSLIRNLGIFLGLPWQQAANEVRVLLPGDLDLMADLDNEMLSAIEKKQVLINVKAEESACIPKLKIIYLATLSLNHVSEESAHYLKQSVSTPEVPINLRDRFYFYLLNETCGFLGSKIINPKRKTDHEGKLRKTVAKLRKTKSLGNAEERAAVFALSHIDMELTEKPIGHSVARLLRDPMVFHMAAHILGYILGDRLYYGLTSGFVPKKRLKKLFLKPLDRPREALEEYDALGRMVREVEMPRRI